jgi:hypothetical protein
MKLGDSKKSFAHYSPLNMDDDIMQARRPMGRRLVAEAEFAMAPSTTAFSSKPSTDRTHSCVAMPQEYW